MVHATHECEEEPTVKNRTEANIDEHQNSEDDGGNDAQENDINHEG